MLELHAKLEEIIELYEKKISDSKNKKWQDQWTYDERRDYRCIITGLNIALGWAEEFSDV